MVYRTTHNLEKYHFFNFPQQLTEQGYWDICDLAVRDVRTKKGIISSYLHTGGTDKKWLPGISDIDILLVYGKEHIYTHATSFEVDMHDGGVIKHIETMNHFIQDMIDYHEIPNVPFPYDLFIGNETFARKIGRMVIAGNRYVERL